MAAGYAPKQENDTLETLFQRADNCMYKFCTNGKHRDLCKNAFEKFSEKRYNYTRTCSRAA